jgi:hypothetical protein
MAEKFVLPGYRQQFKQSIHMTESDFLSITRSGGTALLNFIYAIDLKPHLCQSLVHNL